MKRHQTFLLSLTENMNQTGIKIQIGKAQFHDLTCSQSTGIHQFQHRLITDPQISMCVDVIEQQFNLILIKKIRILTLLLRCMDQEKRIIIDQLLLQKVIIEAAQAGKLASDRGWFQRTVIKFA